MLHVKLNNLPRSGRFEIIRLSLTFMGCFGGFRALFMPFGAGTEEQVLPHAMSLPGVAAEGTDARSRNKMGRIFFAE
ncbi:MAG: hypothetical protein LBD08_02655 [Treponema sp.]|nr:hypothetical protein [Treponema sp.]